MVDVQHLVAALSVGASGAAIAIQFVEDGASPNLGVQGLLLGGAVAVFAFFDRREQRNVRERNEERRENDRRKDVEIEQLRDLNRALIEGRDERIGKLERKIDELNAEIRTLLRGGPG